APITPGAARSSPRRGHQLPLRLGRGHHDPLRSPVEVDLAAHAELAGQVDPGLHRAAGAREERASVVGLVVVEVRPGAVQVAIDRVAGAVDEPLAEAGGLDVGAGRAIANVAR